MAKITLEFDTFMQMRLEEKTRQGQFRPMFENLLPNGKWQVKFVNGVDDPANDPKPPLPTITQRKLLEQLAEESGFRLV